MKTKRLFSLVLALLMLLAAGCAAPKQEEPQQTQAAVTAEPSEEAQIPVTATATAVDVGFGGEISVTLTVTDGKIVDAVVIGDSETTGIGSRAVESMPKALVEAGKPEIDTVAGATVSSKAIIRAAAAAYAQATGVQSAEAEVKMKPGTYQVSAWGYSQAYALPVTVTVSENQILEIKTPDDYMEHGETKVIFQTVIDYLIPRMIENQSFAVDAITGATASSNAVKYAVEEAVAQALAAGGSDPSALEHFRVVPQKAELGQVEEITVDVLAVGLGNSGIMASKRAIETIQAGNGGAPVSYLGIEKAAKIGGQSNMAHELFVVNPQKMKEAYNDGNDYLDAERLRTFWLNYNIGADGTQKCKEDLVDLYINRSGEVVDWLHFDHGYEFETPKSGDLSAAAQEEKFIGTFNLIKFDMSYEDRREAVLGWATGLMDEVKAAGGSYMLETEGYELLYDEATGSVVGAKARNLVTGKEYVIHAKAVIMATGGFGGGELTNELYSNEYYPLKGDYKQFGMAQNDGKMIQAALNIGAGSWNMGMPGVNTGLSALGSEIHGYEVTVLDKMNNRTGRMNTTSINDIPEGFISYTNGLYLNDSGERINNEFKISNSVGNEPNQYYWAGSHYYVLIDEAELKEVYETGFPKGTRWRQYTSQGGVPVETPMPLAYDVMETAIDMGLVFKGDTLEELAAATGMDAGKLAATVERYNQLCEKGVDEDFGKDSALLRAYGEGPYYAVMAYSYPYGSCGGLDVDDQIRVLKADNATPINGLYACGGDSLGVLMCDEKNYSGLGGPANGWAYFSGYIAGESCGSYVLQSAGN